ncbi:MAG: NfeD family protein [Psychromonas sp.]|nr:NfeD family protein [Psychromonas sp.]
MFDYFSQNHDTLLYSIAGCALIIELTLTGLSGALLFFAIGSALTAILISLNIISSWEVEIVFVALLSLASAVFLWKPLKKFQGKRHVVDNSSDLIGHIVIVCEDITLTAGSVRYSGINWTARLDKNNNEQLIKKGSRVKIVAVNGNILLVGSIH